MPWILINELDRKFLALAAQKAENDFVEIALGVKGVYGTRLTGAGFGGSMVAVVQPEAAANLTAAITEHYGPVSGRQATVYVCKASEGVSEIII